MRTRNRTTRDVRPPRQGSRAAGPTLGSMRPIAAALLRRSSVAARDAAVGRDGERLAAGAAGADVGLHGVADQAAGVGAVRALRERVVLVAAAGHEVVHC